MTRPPKPNLSFDKRYAPTDPNDIPMRVHAQLMKAIREKHFVTLKMDTGDELFGEPHVYGVRSGVPTLLLFFAGAGPEWLPISVNRITDVTVWEESTFSKRELPAEYDPEKT
jgi:hypothetical protein